VNVTSSLDVTPFAQSAHTDACCRLDGTEDRLDLGLGGAALEQLVGDGADGLVSAGPPCAGDRGRQREGQRKRTTIQLTG
jgi:hypothetical protein